MRAAVADRYQRNGESRRRNAQLMRSLFLLRALSNGWCTQSELAERHGVQARTIRRDVEALKQHGFTIETRGHDIADAGELTWRLTAWPEKYDLTRGEPVTMSRPKTRDESTIREYRREWHHKMRARGICSLCLRPMDDEIERLHHPECSRLAAKHWRVSEIRALMAEKLRDA